jgi:hypothetical protein
VGYIENGLVVQDTVAGKFTAGVPDPESPCWFTIPGPLSIPGHVISQFVPGPLVCVRVMFPATLSKFVIMIKKNWPGAVETRLIVSVAEGLDPQSSMFPVHVTFELDVQLSLHEPVNAPHMDETVAKGPHATKSTSIPLPPPVA